MEITETNIILTIDIMVDKLSNSAHKARETQKKKKITKPKPSPTDAFTLICKGELGMECVKEYKFHPVRKWRFDYAIPSALVALEVEGGVWTGGRHINPQGFLNDMEKYNSATLMGWSVYRTTPDDLYTGKTLGLLKTAIFGSNKPKINQKSPKITQK